MTPSARRAVNWTALVAVLILYPFVDRAIGLHAVHAVSDGMIYVLLALGLNIVVGYAGLLDLGYAAFFAIGAYAMGLLNSPVLGSPLYGHPWSFWLCIWIAAAVSALLGVVIGAPTLRVRGDYLAIITLGFGEIIPVAIRNLGDITIDIGGWRPIERLNLTGGENGVNPVGRPYLPGVPFETDPIPWYFLILVIGAGSVWAMYRLQDSRLGRAWMAIREDETAADCTGVNPITTKLLAFALGASFSGFAGSVYAAKLQAITPGAFEFQVSIMLLCMVVLGGAGSLGGVVLGAMLITVFDRVLLTQMTTLVRLVGRTLGVPALMSIDLTLWRWFFFGLGLALVMLLRPQGLLGRRERPVADADVDEPATAEPAPPPRVEAIPGWLRERVVAGAATRDGAPILEVRGITKKFGGVIALNGIDLVVPRGAIIGLIGPNGAGKTTFFNVVTGLSAPDDGHITFEGRSLVGLRPNAIVARGIARTFQSIRLFPYMTGAGERAGRRELSTHLARGRCGAPTGLGRGGGSAGARAGPLAARVRRAGRQGGRSGPQPAVRRPAAAGDRPRAGHRAPPAAARRADGGDEPERDGDAHPVDRAPAARAGAVHLADRARHAGRHGHLRSHHRARLRHAHR